MMVTLRRLLRPLMGCTVIVVLAAACSTWISPPGQADRDHDPLATQDAGPPLLRLLLTWLLLLVLLAVEFGISFLAMGRSVRPLILVPAVLMVATVGLMFMQVDRGPTIVRLFATAGLLWLTILLGLGSLDPLTRTDYHVQADSSK